MAVTIIKIGEKVNSPVYMEYMVESEADLALIDISECAPGSIAYTNKDGEDALEELWMLSINGQWNPM